MRLQDDPADAPVATRTMAEFGGRPCKEKEALQWSHGSGWERWCERLCDQLFGLVWSRTGGPGGLRWRTGMLARQVLARGLLVKQLAKRRN